MGNNKECKVINCKLISTNYQCKNCPNWMLNGVGSTTGGWLNGVSSTTGGCGMYYWLDVGAIVLVNAIRNSIALGCSGDTEKIRNVMKELERIEKILKKL